METIAVHRKHLRNEIQKKNPLERNTSILRNHFTKKKKFRHRIILLSNE